jgi:hypothetical protein
MEHTIELTYKAAAVGVGQATGWEGETVSGKLPTLKDLKTGDTLVFKSKQNYKLNIELIPKSMFSTHLFSTDEAFCKENEIHPGGLVTVTDTGKADKTANKDGKFVPYRIYCGFVYDGQTYGYPNSDKLGIGADM